MAALHTISLTRWGCLPPVFLLQGVALNGAVATWVLAWGSLVPLRTLQTLPLHV